MSGPCCPFATLLPTENTFIYIRWGRTCFYPTCGRPYITQFMIDSVEFTTQILRYINTTIIHKFDNNNVPKRLDWISQFGKLVLDASTVLMP